MNKIVLQHNTYLNCIVAVAADPGSPQRFNADALAAEVLIYVFKKVDELVGLLVFVPRHGIRG